MITLLIVSSLIAAFLSGMCRGLHHARRDYPNMNKSRQWITERSWIGGKENGFNQSSIRTADFVHRMILLQVAFLALAAMLLAFAVTQGLAWWVIPIWGALVFHRFEPRGFDMLYNVILPNAPEVPSFTWSQWFTAWITP
jgi:hypothetical protein